MPTLAELKAKVDELQTTVDLEQQQIADLLAEKEATNAALAATNATLTATIATLEGQVADGGTPEARQEVIDQLNGIKADIEATVAGTPPPPPPPEEPEG